MDSKGFFREYRLKVYPDKEIPTEKYEPIKKAIQDVLNDNEPIQEQDEIILVRCKRYYSPDELLEAQKKAFEAGWQSRNNGGYKFKGTYQDDFIKSLNKQ